MRVQFAITVVLLAISRCHTLHIEPKTRQIDGFTDQPFEIKCDDEGSLAPGMVLEWIDPQGETIGRSGHKSQRKDPIVVPEAKQSSGVYRCLVKNVSRYRTD